MGYYTNYTLTWETQDDYKEVRRCAHRIPAGANFCPVCGLGNENVFIDERIKEYIKKNENMLYALGEDGAGGGECKWYDHKKDMIAMSLSFKDVLLKLHGEGEEAGDLWNEYYINGKMQLCKAKIIYPDYDEGELT